LTTSNVSNINILSAGLLHYDSLIGIPSSETNGRVRIFNYEYQEETIKQVGL